jgi:hypothetical protein
MRLLSGAPRGAGKKRWQMGEETVTTGVDGLIKFLEGKEKISMLDAASELGVNLETMQTWVDFLVEERVLGIEYKFTKPFIYLNKENTEKGKILGEEELTWDAYHRNFLMKAKEKHIPDVEAANLWKKHVLALLDEKEAFFKDEGRKRALQNIDQLWGEYKTTVLMKI